MPLLGALSYHRSSASSETSSIVSTADNMTQFQQRDPHGTCSDSMATKQTKNCADERRGDGGCFHAVVAFVLRPDSKEKKARNTWTKRRCIHVSYPRRARQQTLRAMITLHTLSTKMVALSLSPRTSLYRAITTHASARIGSVESSSFASLCYVVVFVTNSSHMFEHVLTTRGGKNRDRTCPPTFCTNESGRVCVKEYRGN